ncbi:MAG: hypothetical protein IPN22_07445 [Bacteroidetes bacterium]|nr:hypothetical protein [Bacteroidota bacterium]
MRADISRIIKELESNKINTNLEAIVVDDNNEIFIASDNKEGGKCETATSSLTAFVKLKWDNTSAKPEAKPEPKKTEEDPRASLTIDCLSDTVYCSAASACKIGNDDPFCGYKLIWNPFTNCKQLIKGHCDTLLLNALPVKKSINRAERRREKWKKQQMK